MNDLEAEYCYYEKEVSKNVKQLRLYGENRRRHKRLAGCIERR